MKRILYTVWTVVFVLILTTAQASAHRVDVFAYSEGDTILTESYFPDGRKVQGGKIEVYDAAGIKLLEGITDEQGTFNFKISKKSDLKIVLIASMGHKNSFLLKSEEIDTVAPGGAAMAAVSTPVEENVKSGTKQAAVTQSSPSKTRRRMEPPKESHTVAIIAGLGFIMGLTSLILHFTKKNGTEKS